VHLQFHSVKKPSENHDTWVRVVLGASRGRVRFRFGSGSCTFFTFGFGSVLGKTWVLVRFVLAGFGLFPITIKRSR